MASAEPTVIFETVHGSRAYGLATEASDTDLRGVFVPARLAFDGYKAGPDQLEPSAERVSTRSASSFASPRSATRP